MAGATAGSEWGGTEPGSPFRAELLSGFRGRRGQGRGSVAGGGGEFQKPLPRGWTEGTMGPGSPDPVRCLGSADGSSGQSEAGEKERSPRGAAAGRRGG